ncbi:MAG: hypothetical protein HFF50_10575 [Lawsonibacter sp.]|nr:hypothetical protein [Lawsonibacter sp.]
MMDEKYMLTAEQYYQLYCKAFARLDKIATLAEQTMQELEELQLAMAKEEEFKLILFPSRSCESSAQ